MDQLDDIKFNLTPIMANKLIEINDLKIKLNEIDNKINSKEDTYSINELLKEKEKIDNEIDMKKKDFIKEFQKHNQKQINQYLNLKDKES